MQKINEELVDYIMKNKNKEDIQEEVYQKYGVILQDIQTSNKDDGLLVNKYPNIFTIKYQDNYQRSLPLTMNYVLFDIADGLYYDNQLVKYNFKFLDGTETTKSLKLYDYLVKQKHFEPKIVQKEQQDQDYLVILQYSPSLYRSSLFPQKLSFIMSPILSTKILRTDIKLINSLEQENTEKFKYISYVGDNTTNFDTPLNKIIQQQIKQVNDDYLLQRQWYNIGVMLEKIEKTKKEQAQNK